MSEAQECQLVESWPLGDGIGHVRLLDTMPDMRLLMLPDYRDGTKRTKPGDKRIVDAARVSIAGEEVRATSDDRRLIRYLLKNKHTSPFEQVRFTFSVKVPIFIARQWLRHRTASVNEQSARYGKLSDEFYVPDTERLMNGGQAKDNKQGSSAAPFGEKVAGQMKDIMLYANVDAYDRYNDLLNMGLSRELARTVLPVSIYTQFYWSIDLHNLMHFLRLRIHPHAQWEIQRYARAMEKMVTPLAPYAMEAWREALSAKETPAKPELSDTQKRLAGLEAMMKSGGKPSVRKHFSDYIDLACNHLGLSTREAARVFGCSQTTIRRWRAGTCVPLASTLVLGRVRRELSRKGVR